MKIRTDYVTNSSSSSFIFDENGKKEILKHKKDIEFSIKAGVSEWLHDVDMDYYEVEITNAIQTFEEICKFKPIREYWYLDLIEVLDWYGLGRYDYLEEKPATEFTDEELRIAAAYTVFDMFRKEFNDFSIFDDKPFDKDNFTREEIEERLYAIFNSELWSRWSRKPFKEWVSQDFDRMLNAVLQYAGVKAGELAEIILDARYMHFDFNETHHAIVDSIEKYIHDAKMCTHMG